MTLSKRDPCLLYLMKYLSIAVAHILIRRASGNNLKVKPISSALNGSVSVSDLFGNYSCPINTNHIIFIHLEVRINKALGI